MGVLDWFRIAAAFLVTAIHISPLEDISAQGDLVLTRILARVAVPFFFMVTGYFVLDKERPGRVRRAIVKNLKWYLLAVFSGPDYRSGAVRPGVRLSGIETGAWDLHPAVSVRPDGGQLLWADF